MQIKKITDQNLLINLKRYVQKERKLTALIIEHLHEVERRKLYSDHKYTSLFSYCVKELNYSEDQAYRRINAMRIAKKVPQVIKQLDAGSMTLSNINLFSAANSELELNPTEQNSLLTRMAYHSKRECEDTISEVREEKGKTKPVKKDHARVDKSGKIRLNVSMDRKLYDKLQGIRHDKGLSLEQTLAFLVEKQLVPEPVPTPKSRKGKSVGAGRYIPKRVRAEVIKRDLSRCSICKSTHKIQLDHATPIAHGGKSEQKNLRLLCRNCNLRAGIKVFGLQAMKR